MKYDMVLINATASTEGGALSILLQLLENINPRMKSPFKRLSWDNYGFKRWCKINNILPNLIISMQNIVVNFNNNVKQLIYYHQPTPLVYATWSILKSDEISLWFYKHIYPLFVKYFVHHNTFFVAQFDWIKQKINQKFNIALESIYVVNSSIHKFDIEKLLPLNLDCSYSLFYPAANYKYKNHVEVINSIKWLVENNYNIRGLKIYFTLDMYSSMPLWSLIKTHRLNNYFEFIGTQPYNVILKYYKSCNLVVFPSYLETFGLPLIEAAKFGKQILTVDLDYAKAVIDGYKGVKFLPINSSIN